MHITNKFISTVFNS